MLANSLIVSNNDGAEHICLALDGSDLIPRLSSVLEEFAPDAIYGYSSFVMRVAEFINESVRGSVTVLRISGERVGAELERSLAGAFPSARITQNYVSAEAGRISSAPCGHLPMNRYHPAKGVTIEILDRDESGVGELLVSKRAEGALPLDRYRIGDVGRVVAGSCACGAPDTFEVLGRSGYDYLKVAGAIIRRDEVERVVRLCAEYIKDYRVEASLATSEDKLKGCLELIVVPRDGERGNVGSHIAETFNRELMMTPTRTLGALVEEGLFLPLSIRFVEAFPAMAKDLKLSMKSS